MYLFIVSAYLLIFSAAVSHGSIQKCCGFHEYLHVADGTHQCIQNTNKRLGILAESADFIKNYLDGECVDYSKSHFFNFTITGGNVVLQTPLHGTAFMKCCPLGYKYHSQLHACTEDVSVDQSFITENFVRVGLPHCKLIIDKKEDAPKESDDFCIDRDEHGSLVRRECAQSIDKCDDIRCVKKCCPDGQSFVNGAKCTDTYVHGLNLTFSKTIEEPLIPFAIISNRTCRRIYLMNENRYIFKLDVNGTFKYWQNVTNSYVNEPVSNPHSYCIEHSNKSGAVGYYLFMCFPENPVKEKFEYTLVPKILSCVFLVLTMVIYLLLNETRNIFGKILLNYCMSTLFLFSLLVYAQIDLNTTDKSCKLTGYSLIFFSTVSFAWLNVMCCDIWFTFGCTKQSIGAHQRRKDLKRLLLYLLYGYGMPTILTLIIFGCSTQDLLPYSIRPYVGEVSCFIEVRPNNYAAVLFVRLPHLILQIANVVLFIKTITYCLKIKNEINKINDTTRNEKSTRLKKDKERLFLILKLSVIMGVTYIFDTLTGFVNMSCLGLVPKYIEITWDFINCLQGVFIFIIFICKKKILYSVLRKLNVPIKIPTRPTMQSTMSSTTRVSMVNHTPSVKNGSIKAR